MGGKILPGDPFQPMTVRDYASLRAAIDARRRALGITFEALDQISGVADGYSSKLACGLRSFGPMSLPSILDALQLELVVHATNDQATEAA